MSTISCTEFERLLNDAVESNGNVTGMPLLEHANACPGCRELWQQYCLLERAVAGWRDRVPHLELVEAVVARFAFEDISSPATVAADSRPQPDRKSGPEESTPRRRAWASVAVAALVLGVAVWTLLHTSSAPRDLRKGESPLATAETPSPHALAATNDAELETLVEHAGNAYMVLANQTAEAFVEASRVVAPTRIALLQTNETNPDAPRPTGLGNEFKPMGREFGKALDFLFDAVAPETPPSI